MKRVVALIAMTGMLLINTESNAELLSADLRMKLKFGHKLSCRSTIQSQLDNSGFERTREQIESYCECLGSLYFDDFTVEDYQYLMQNQALPLRLMVRRKEFQNACTDQYLVN